MHSSHTPGPPCADEEDPRGATVPAAGNGGGGEATGCGLLGAGAVQERIQTLNELWFRLMRWYLVNKAVNNRVIAFTKEIEVKVNFQSS